MNEKHAKRLRRRARIECQEIGIPLETIYTTEQTGGREIEIPLEDGTTKSIVVPTYQVVIGHCLRGVYRKVKKAFA